MKIIRYAFFLGMLVLTGQSGWAQRFALGGRSKEARSGVMRIAADSLGFTVSGRRCIPEGDCGGDSTVFRADTAIRGARSWLWTFGDPTDAAKNTASGRVVRHLYTRDQTYTVTLTVGRTGGLPDTTFRQEVRINPLPPSFEFFGGKEDTLICPKDSILLDPYQGRQAPPGVAYSWYPTGATTQTIWASQAKCYSVEVKDTLTGCSVTDRINVKICGQNDQQQAAKWYFGANAGVSFEGGQPTAITDGKVNTPEGVSAISNKQGELLFYTDGVSVFDKEGNSIRWRNPADSVRAGGKLAGSGNSTQSALIVPQPECRGCETIYYIFTTNDSTKQLSYTIVDMRGNRGKGEIVEANVPLHGGTTERVSSVQNPQDSTYWVVTRDTASNNYRFYKVTKTGVIEAGPPRPLGTPNLTNPQSEGYLKFSNNGKKLAIVIPGPPRNFVEVYDFNDSTGATSNKVTIDLGPSPPRAYGVEFSPDGTNMFVSFTGDSAGTVASKILAYNVERMDSTAIALTRITVDSTKGVRYGALQYAPDGKIYVAVEGRTFLGVINNPDTTTAREMDFVREGLSLDGKRSLLGLPNFVQSIIQPPSGPGISYSDTCFGTPTQFQSGPICEPRKDTYEWDFGDGSKGSGQQVSHLYARPGQYTVKLRQFNDCKDTTMTAQITILASPKVNLGQDINQCRPSVTLDVGPQAVDTAFVYLWYRNGRYLGQRTNRPQLTVDSSGQYVVLVSTKNIANPCFDLDTIQVNLIQPRPINLGSDTTLCPGQRVTLAPRGLQVSSATYQWTLGGNPVGSSSTLNVDRAGTYILTVTDNSRGNIECVNSDTLVVGSGQKPRIQANLRDATGCQTIDGRIEVTPQGQGGSAGVNFTWYRDGTALPITQSTPILDNVGIGTYRLTLFYSDQNGPTTCTLDTTFTLNARNPDVQVERERLTNATCTQPNGGEIILRTVRGAPVTYVWRNSAGQQLPNQTGPTLTGVPAGTYSVEVRDANDCRFTLGNLILRQDPTRLVTLRDTAACAGQSLQLDAGTLGDTYRWSNGATTRTITVTQPGAYNVLVTDSRTGCSSRDTAVLRFNPKPNIVVGPTQSVCANVAPLQLAATPAGGTWSGTGVTPQGLFRPAQVLNGNVTLTYSVSQQGCADSARKVLNVLPIPTVDLGPDRSFCANEAQTLSVPEVPPATYRWSTGATTSTITPTRTGMYSVSVALGTCRAADTVRVTVLPAPVFSLKGEVPLCAADRDTVTLDAGGLPGYTYRWNPGGETTRRIQIDRLGTYRVRVSTPEGCTEERPVEVFDECDPRIVVPDIFTPNGDGVNDRLDVFTAHISEYQLTIFNRWGEMVFRTNDPTEKWDGSYKGAQYPTQSYAWVIAYKSAYFPERGTQYKRGAVLVAR